MTLIEYHIRRCQTPFGKFLELLQEGRTSGHSIFSGGRDHGPVLLSQLPYIKLFEVEEGLAACMINLEEDSGVLVQG